MSDWTNEWMEHEWVNKRTNERRNGWNEDEENEWINEWMDVYITMIIIHKHFFNWILPENRKISL